MLDLLFGTILPADAGTVFSGGAFLWCTLCSLVMGAVIAAFHTFRNNCSKSFVVTLALLPAIVQMVITLVNGNLGTGVAVMGAFSLIRFRSAPGSAREICSIFLAMAVGLATGMGYLGIAVLFVLLIGGANLLYTLSRFGEPKTTERHLKITIPEGLEYDGVFDEILARYTTRWELTEVRTTGMGSLYKLNYRVQLRNTAGQKTFLDELRQRNGNLEIVCGKPDFGREDL